MNALPHPLPQGRPGLAGTARVGVAALQAHWPEYLMEAWGLGMLMLVAAAAGALLPPSVPRAWQRVAVGAAVAVTGALLVYSRWGRQSGAHFNPAMTFVFLMLGKVRPWDAVFYIVFQTAGAAAGLLIAALCFGDALRQPPVEWLATYPTGMRAALPFMAEFLASFVVMSLILSMGGAVRIARYTGLAGAAASLVFSLFEVQATSFSLNPAHSLVSAVPSGHWDGVWIYLLAPPAGMLLAAFVNRRVLPLPPMLCAKLMHDGSTRCIHCGYRPIRRQVPGQRQAPGIALPPAPG